MSQGDDGDDQIIRHRGSIDDEPITLSDLHEKLLHQHDCGGHDISDTALVYIFIVFIVVGSALILTNLWSYE